MPKDKRKSLGKVSRLLCRHRLGVTETEASQDLGWHRRTTNNYLRELAEDNQAEKAERLPKKKDVCGFLEIDMLLLHALQHTFSNLFSKQLSYRRYTMARKHAPNRFENIYDAVKENPGKNPSLIAQILGLARSTITRSLPAMEDEGYLLSEDDEGKLWTFKRKS